MSYQGYSPERFLTLCSDAVGVVYSSTPPTSWAMRIWTKFCSLGIGVEIIISFTPKIKRNFLIREQCCKRSLWRFYVVHNGFSIFSFRLISKRQEKSLIFLYLNSVYFLNVICNLTPLSRSYFGLYWGSFFVARAAWSMLQQQSFHWSICRLFDFLTFRVYLFIYLFYFILFLFTIAKIETTLNRNRTVFAIDGIPIHALS